MFGNLAEMAKLMGKAKDIQANLKKFKEELPTMEFSASSPGDQVRVTVSGDFRVKSITVTEAATADRELLAQLTGFALTRGVLCAFRRPAPRTVEQVCAHARRVAVLEGIVDSTNVGAIFRSAAALNMDAVLITPSCCDPLCRRAVRVSMGTVFQVPWTRIGDQPGEEWPQGGIAKLRSLGFKTAAMALDDNSVSLDCPELKECEKLAIIMGTEGDGLSQHTIAACDYTVKIPMAHGVDSLNVAAASAVAFWELRAR